MLVKFSVTDLCIYPMDLFTNSVEIRHEKIQLNAVGRF
jgi:hypothetical protein